MNYREYYAGLALQGMVACSETHGNADDFAKWSVEYADALCDALGITPNKDIERKTS